MWLFHVTQSNPSSLGIRHQLMILWFIYIGLSHNGITSWLSRMRMKRHSMHALHPRGAQTLRHFKRIDNRWCKFNRGRERDRTTLYLEFRFQITKHVFLHLMHQWYKAWFSYAGNKHLGWYQPGPSVKHTTSTAIHRHQSWRSDKAHPTISLMGNWLCLKIPTRPQLMRVSRSVSLKLEECRQVWQLRGVKRLCVPRYLGFMSLNAVQQETSSGRVSCRSCSFERQGSILGRHWRVGLAFW